MSYIILRGHWCNIIVLNVYASYEDKSDDIKESFYEELGCDFDQFPGYNTGREDTSKPTIRNDGLTVMMTTI
jgi:hypothetical protein